MTEPSEIYFSSELRVDVRQANMSDILVAEAAWISSGADYDVDDFDRIEGLIKYLMKNRHGTPFEHNSITFRIKAPIFVWREFMRHRIGISYNEESGRYKQLAPDFYIPGRERDLVQTGKPGHYIYQPGTEDQYKIMCRALEEQCVNAYRAYEDMLRDGITREVARMCLPVNIYSSAYVTMNARSLMNFLGLRTKSEAALFPSTPMKEINTVADKIEMYFEEYMPITAAAFNEAKRVAP